MTGEITHPRQTCAIAGTAFGSIAKSAAGLVLLAVTLLVILLMPALMALRGVPLFPRTAHILTVLTAPVADNPRLPWVRSARIGTSKAQCATGSRGQKADEVSAVTPGEMRTAANNSARTAECSISARAMSGLEFETTATQSESLSAISRRSSSPRS